MRWSNGEKLVVGLAAAAAVTVAIVFGCSQPPAPPPILPPVATAVAPVLPPVADKKADTIVPIVPEKPVIAATSEQAKPATEAAKKTDPVVRKPDKVVVKRPARNDEPAAYVTAARNAERAFCLRWLVDFKAESDIKAGRIEDWGNVRFVDPDLCDLVIARYYKK